MESSGISCREKIFFLRSLNNIVLDVPFMHFVRRKMKGGGEEDFLFNGLLGIR